MPTGEVEHEDDADDVVDALLVPDEEPAAADDDDVVDDLLVPDEEPSPK